MNLRVSTSPTQALPLVKGISNQICFLIINYFTNDNIWTKQVFSSNQYAYIKDDLASLQRPSIFCYPIDDNKNSFSFSVRGHVILELHFNLKEQRVKLAENVIQIANLIQLIIINGDIDNYCKPQMPGLFWIGKEWQTDYSKIYDKESIVKMKLDFNVDLTAYKYELQSMGRDVTSPDEQIYQIAQYLKEIVTPI